MATPSFLWVIRVATIFMVTVEALSCQSSSPGCNSTFSNLNGTCPSCNATILDCPEPQFVDVNFTEDHDDGVCSLEELFKGNFTEVNSICSIEDWNKASFVEYDGVCLLEDVFDTVSEYTEDVCPFRDASSYFTFEEVEEEDSDCWAGNYFDTDSNSCKPIPNDVTLPEPILISVSPTVGYCVKQNQPITVRVKNFPAFSLQDVSVALSLRGKPFMQLDSTNALYISFSGNLYQSDANITLIPYAPTNGDHGIATFVISAKLSASLQSKIEFEYLYQLYFVGPPTNIQHSPPFVYKGQIYTVLVRFSNFMPIKMISNDAVSFWGYNFTNFKVEIIESTSDGTALQIELGKMQTLGNFFIKICTNDSESNYSCAQTANLSVREPPAPTTLSSTVFPKAVSAGDSAATLNFLVQYLPKSTNISDVIINLRIQSGQRQLKIVSIRSMSDLCEDTICALDQITVQLPTGGNPDGDSISGTYIIDVMLYNSSMGQLTFNYESVTKPAIQYASRRSLVLPLGSNTERITIILRNFPSSSCSESCYLQLPQTTVAKFGTILTNFTLISMSNRLVTLELVVPANDKAEIVQVVIESTSNGTKANVSFDFEFTAPPAVVHPVDGVTLGGTVVTITAIGWGDLKNVISASNLSASKLNISFDGKQANVQSILEAKSSPYSVVRAVVLTPPKSDNLTGIVKGRIGLTDFEAAVSLFEWQYFAMPEISNANPEIATVGGFTGAAVGNTTILSIRGFPRVRLLSSLNVIFRPQGTSTDLNTSILSFSNSQNVLRLTVFVPSISTTRNSTATIRVSYHDPNPAFSVRTAVLDSFQYFVPRTEVAMARWCAECNNGASCIVNGRCANGQTPLNNQAGLMVAGTLVVVFRNVYIVESTADLNLTIVFGNELQNTSRYSRISSLTDRYGHYATVVAEFGIPALSRHTCKMKANINSTVSASILDRFNCVDMSISIACQSVAENSIPCAGPSDAPFEFVARISGLSHDLISNNTLMVVFGDMAGLVLNVTRGRNLTSLVRIRAPRFTSFSGSSATVTMVIHNQDSSVSVSKPWEFWKSPSIVGVNFNTLGTQIQVLFNQPTDRGGFADTCEPLLANEVKSTLGNTFVCIWTDDTLMTIILGRRAFARVGDTLSVLGLQIRSKNGLSSPMPQSSRIISPPEIVQIPRITVWGPNTIDPCSSLTIHAKGISPRALSFNWSCSNDNNLNRYLRALPTSVSSIALVSGTPELASLDTTYIISVVATDFMGSTSEPATIRVLKKSSASPQFVFSPPRHEIFRSQPVLIMGDAEFSECPIPKERMKYSWRKASGPSLLPIIANRVNTASGPQLFLPANSLQAGETYIFAITLRMGEDISKSSESIVTVSVAFQPVVAKLSGGGHFLFSTLSKWQLDARQSLDLDDETAPLSFKWSCRFLDGDAMSPCTDVNGGALVLANGPLLQIDNNTLAATQDTPYLFSVSVQDSAMRKPPDTAAVFVKISSSPVIPVHLRLLSASGLRGSEVVVSRDESAVFYGDCDFTSDRSQSISWNINPGNENMQKLLESWNGSPFLIVETGVFRGGLRYAITVSCSETVADGTTIKGNGSMTIETNEPPSGGSCLVCLLGSVGCRTSGRPIVDQFRISCMNWADQDNPLQYRFGFSSDEDGDIFWTAYRPSSFLDVVLPSGKIKIFAQVQDSLGESSPVIGVTEGAGLQVGTGPSRRLLASGIDWTAALAQVQDLAAKQDSKGMNSLIGSMALQLSFESEANVLDRETTKAYTLSLLRSAWQALSYAVKTNDNVCESFSVVQKLASNPEFLGVWSAINASSIVKAGVDDQSIMEKLDQNCISSALDIFDAIRNALRNISIEGRLIVEEKTFLATEQSAIESLVHLYSSTLTTAHMPFSRSNSITFHTISRMDMAKLGEEISFSVDQYVPRTNASVSFSLPQQLLSGLKITDNGLNTHASASSYAPASSDLLIRSPVVGLTLSRPNSSSPVTVSGLSDAINISIPIQAMSEAAWTNFSQQVQCMYWDSGRKTYSTDGVKVSNVTKTHVVCQSSHLTDFVLSQNLSINIVSPKPESPKPESTTKIEAGIPDHSFSFEGMLLVVGNRSAALAMAKMQWKPTNISLIQSKQAIELALRSAGGFGVPCTASVPFLALPGLVLSTVEGTIYPRDFAMAVETSRPAVQNNTLVSAITKFAVVQGSSAGPVRIEIAGFALSQNRRSTACAIGTEWRYQHLGMAEYFACSCAANTACRDETVCVGAPASGDRWAVAAVSSGLCAPPSKVSSTSDQSLALGLGLGLGLGLPLTAGLGYALFLLHRDKGKTGGYGRRISSPASDPESMLVFADPKREEETPKAEQGDRGVARSGGVMADASTVSV